MQQLFIPIIQTKPMKSTTSSIHTNMFKITIVILLAVMISGCEEPPWVLTNYQIVNNNTNKEILILIDYPLYKSECKIQDIKGLQTNDTVSSYVIPKYYLGFTPLRLMNLWIYNKTDSTYSVFYEVNDKVIDPKILERKTTTIKKGRTGDLIYTTTFIVTDSLLTQMKKDTHLTDSVFGLKK
jgi:hypothetical protein